MSHLNLSPDELKMLAAMARDKKMSVEELYAQLNVTPSVPVPPQPEPEEITVQLWATEEGKHELPDLTPAQVSDMAPLPPAVEEPKQEEHATTVQVCSQCGWNQNEPSIEVTEKDKLTFLQCFLGQQVFRKEYSVLNNQAVFVFRSLTVKEIDAIYTEAFNNKNITTTEDFYEYINRLRLNLQLVRFSPSVGAPVLLPDGLDKITNKSADSYWQPFLENTGNYNPEKSLMSNVHDYVMEHVIFAESMQRIAHKLCSSFNTLQVKLEANVTNANFWKTTEQLR